MIATAAILLLWYPTLGHRIDTVGIDNDCALGDPPFAVAPLEAVYPACIDGKVLLDPLGVGRHAVIGTAIELGPRDIAVDLNHLIAGQVGGGREIEGAAFTKFDEAVDPADVVAVVVKSIGMVA